MQIKKDDMRNTIILEAEKEFLKRTYKNSSMRTIAKKSNTSMGNIYNYFTSKEALLDEIISDTPENINHLLQHHDIVSILPFEYSKEDIENNFNEIFDKYSNEFFPTELLLSNSLLILIDSCEGTKYEKYKDDLLFLFQSHIATHLKVEPTSFLAKSLTYGFVSTLVFIGKNKNTINSEKKDLMNYIKYMVIGMPLK